jgi:hypothetical protein
VKGRSADADLSGMTRRTASDTAKRGSRASGCPADVSRGATGRPSWSRGNGGNYSPSQRSLSPIRLIPELPERMTFT